MLKSSMCESERTGGRGEDPDFGQMAGRWW